MFNGMVDAADPDKVSKLALCTEANALSRRRLAGMTLGPVTGFFVPIWFAGPTSDYDRRAPVGRINRLEGRAILEVTLTFRRRDLATATPRALLVERLPIALDKMLATKAIAPLRAEIAALRPHLDSFIGDLA